MKHIDQAQLDNLKELAMELPFGEVEILYKDIAKIYRRKMRAFNEDTGRVQRIVRNPVGKYSVGKIEIYLDGKKLH